MGPKYSYAQVRIDTAEWLVVHSYPLEWIVEASIPLLIWISLFAFGYMQSRQGGFRTRVNVLAISGAFLAFVSFSTGWRVIESGNDWSIQSDYALFLLFTYPFAVITPLAGIGQAGVLLWVLSYAQENDAGIVPFYAYSIAWISVALMIAAIAWPVGLPRNSAKPDVSDRLLTLTIRRVSHPWTVANRSLSIIFVVAFLVTGYLYLELHARLAALPLLLVGLAFVIIMIRRNPQT
jgi:hypothetical protein